MTVPLRIAFLAAGGAAMGGGHVVRSLSIADALAAQQATCTFFVSRDATGAAPLLARSRHRLAVATDASDALAQARQEEVFDWTVIDNYAVSREGETPWRAISRKILVIDDLANRPHDCDLLLDSAPGRQTRDYAALVPTGTRLLLGPAYAPLRGEFARKRHQALEKRQKTLRIDRLLISFGLTDPGGITAQAVSEISAAMPDLAIDVVVAAQTPSAAAIHALVRPNVALHSDPSSMSDLMIAADLALGAGGSTAWERACLGLPSVALILADNQRALALGLAKMGTLRAVEWDQSWQAIIAALGDLRESGAWRAMSRQAANVCDGRGALRIMLELDPPLSRRRHPVRLRPVEPSDSDRILEWQSAPGAREFSSNPTPPTREDHEAWMARKLEEPRCVFNVITEQDHPVGVLRLDQRLDGSFMTSILVAGEARGHGVGSAALEAAARLMQGSDLWARIDPRNIASLRSFERSGFLQQENCAYKRASAT